MKMLNLFLLNRSNIFIAILGVVFFSMTLYKASHSSFTHDESFTYLSYVKKSFIGIITMEEPISANNHILNSLSMKVVDKILPPTPFNLRLPNLMGHLFFLVFSALISINFRNNFLKISSFILLNANIYLLDIFSLARGYGLSLGILMAHCYFLQRIFLQKTPDLSFKLCLTFLLLSVVSNFSILYYVASFFLVISIYLIKTKSSIFNFTLIKRNIYVFFAFSILGIAILGGPIFKLIKHKQLYFGGNNNIFKDTIYSLVFYSLDGINLSSKTIQIIYVLVLILIIVLTFWFLKKVFQNNIINMFFIITGCMLLIGIIQITLFYIVDTKFLIQRTAIFLIPLFMLSVIYLIDEICNLFMHKLVAIISLIMGLIVIFYLPKHNSLNWKYDAENELLLSNLEMYHSQSNNSEKLKLGIDWIFQPSLNFYRATTNTGLWLDTLKREGFEDGNYEFYFVESSNMSKFVDTNQFNVLKKYPITGNLLIKNKNFDK